MDSFDLKVENLLSVLASIVNSASGPLSTSADVKVVKVPLGLLYEAKRALVHFEGTEFDTKSIRQALRRNLTETV